MSNTAVIHGVDPSMLDVFYTNDDLDDDPYHLRLTSWGFTIIQLYHVTSKFGNLAEIREIPCLLKW